MDLTLYSLSQPSTAMPSAPTPLTLPVIRHPLYYPLVPTLIPHLRRDSPKYQLLAPQLTPRYSGGPFHTRQHAMEFRHAMRWSSAGSFAASLAFSYVHTCSSTTTTLPHVLLFLSLSNWSRAPRGDLLAATFRRSAVWVRR